MAGRFMDKETLEAEAERLQLDLTGLKWPQKQKAVLDAQRLEKEGKPVSSGMQEKLSTSDADGDLVSDFELDRMSERIAKHYEESSARQVKQETVHVHVEVSNDPMDQMRGKEVMICPEMAATPNQLFGYEEELDEEIIVEEVRHDVDSAYRAGKDIVTGTYTVKEKTGRKVVAHTALPKEGCGIFFRPDRDRVPVVVSKGRRGYLWTHHRLPNIKQLLIESGYYEDYRNRFKDEPYIWHSSGKILCCDIQLAESVLRDIERREAEARAMREQNAEFIRKVNNY